jgi:pimeloyl-ACP methyl ester carboxylesterase
LEAGAGGDARTWGQLQYKLARTTRTCAYDRAGLGFSDEGPQPRNAIAVAADLDAALRAGGLNAPYVLVAHSLGSYFSLLFTDLHPREVGGIVLLDPSSIGQDARQKALVPKTATSTEDFIKTLKRCAAKAQASEPKHEPEPDCRFGPVSTPGFYRTMASEIETMPASSAELITRKRDYGEMPLVVMSADWGDHPAYSPTENQALAELWLQMHEEMAGLASRGELRKVEGAGHCIQCERPDMVVAIVNEVVAKVRARSSHN